MALVLFQFDRAGRRSLAGSHDTGFVGQVERAVLAQAVIRQVEDRILVHGNKTLVSS